MPKHKIEIIIDEENRSITIHSSDNKEVITRIVDGIVIFASDKDNNKLYSMHYGDENCSFYSFKAFYEYLNISNDSEQKNFIKFFEHVENMFKEELELKCNEHSCSCKNKTNDSVKKEFLN
jgi:hypothetical protein